MGARSWRRGCPGLTRWLAVALLLVLPPALRAEEEKVAKPEASAAWRDLAVLEKRLGEACDAAEEVCQAKFTRRPTVRISTPAEMRTLLAKEFGHLKPFEGQDADAFGRTMAGFVLGKYDEEAHAVHVLPENAGRLASMQGEKEGLGEDELRVLLAHEVVHALDWQRFRFDAIYRARATIDGLMAFNAVSEGHAQWVAEAVAKRWGLGAAFDRLTRWIVDPPTNLTELERTVLAPLTAQVTFAYVHGLEFLRAVDKAQGLKGVEAALRAPPASTRDIEQPQRWLAALAGGEAPANDPDLPALLAELRVLAGDPAWTVQTMRVLEAVLRTQVGKLVPEDRPKFLEGYQDGHSLSGSVAGEDVMLATLVLLFEQPAHASAFAGMERRGGEALKGVVAPGIEIVSSAFSDGAGQDRKLAGFRMRREVKIAGGVQVLEQQVAAVGRIVIEVLAVNVPSLDAAALGEAVSRAALRLTDPEAASKAPPLTPRPFVRTASRSWEVLVTGPDGVPVPRANLQAEGYEPRTAGVPPMGPRKSLPEVELTLRDGRATMGLRGKGPCRISVWGATDADGKPLPMAPRSHVPMPDAGGVLELKLEPGLEIHGKVVDAEGKPVQGLRVEARPNIVVGSFTDSLWHLHASDVTTAEGTFALVGVADLPYRLQLTRDDRPASVDESESRGGARDVVMIVRPPRTVTLTVLDADGKPVQDASVSARPMGPGRHALADTDVDGIAVLEGLDPKDKVMLKIDPPEDRPLLGVHERGMWVPEDTTIRLPRGFVIRGRVVDAEGKGQRASVLHKPGEGRGSFSDTKPDGTFEIRHVPLGPVKVAAGPVGEMMLEMRVADGDWTEVTPETGEVTLRIVRLGPLPWERAQAPPAPLPPEPERVTLVLRVKDSTVVRSGQMARHEEKGFGPGHRFKVGADGRAEVPKLIPGRYVLWIHPTQEDARCVYLPDVEVAKEPLEVTLVPSEAIRFRLKVPEGSRVDEAAAHGPLGSLLEATLGSDGVYEVRGLPPGTWAIRAKVRAPTAWLYAKVEAATGTETEVEPKPKTR